MFFYVDESGNTGANLFDSNQPSLYYGVLSSIKDLEVHAKMQLVEARNYFKVERLHANEMGNKGLVYILPHLLKIQSMYEITFDIYRVAKADHALICFFDQTFDPGLNPAVTWTGYWTPLRYIFLLKVASLFDEDTLKQAWAARIDLNDESAEAIFVDVCRIIRSRVDMLPDARSRQVIGDALLWAEKQPKKIRYNVKRKSDLLQITPNIIGFQSVMLGIAVRLKKDLGEASRIVVDQQLQFNKAQQTLSQHFALMRDSPLINGPGLPEIDFSGIPDIPISFESGSNSIGLELVDIYLWVFKRFMEKKELAPELLSIIRSQINRGQTDEISISGIVSLWSRWFEELPEPTDEQKEKAKQLMEIGEKRRLRAMRADT